MITYKDNNYELKFNLKTVRQIEGVLNKGIIAAVRESGGMLSVNDIITMAGYGLYNENGNRVSPVQGMEIAENYMIERGYAELLSVVIQTLERDCPFFFLVD